VAKSKSDFDYEGIKALAKDLGRPAETLIALSSTNDPFYIIPCRQAEAQWFADLWNKFGMGKGGHTRGLHYRIVSQRTATSLSNGER